MLCYVVIYRVVPHSKLSLFITPITMVYGTYNYSYWDYNPFITGGGVHCQSERYPATNDKFFAGERRYSH